MRCSRVPPTPSRGGRPGSAAGSRRRVAGAVRSGPRRRGRVLLAVPALVVGLVVPPLASHAEAGCGAEVAGRVQAHYRDLPGLTARFTQSSQVVALGDAPLSGAATSSGEVSFARPGRMRWAYEEPEESLVVTDGEVLWIYDPNAREAQKLHAGEGFLSGAALQFLLGEGDLQRDFEVRAEECGKETARLTLVPREEAPYEKLQLTVDAGSGAIRETAVHDLIGNVTRVVFEDVRADPTPDASRFRFVPPEDVTVVEVPVAEP